jgi:hypothetical protein
MKYEDLLIIKKGYIVKKDVVVIPTPSSPKKAPDLHIWKTYKSEAGKLSFEYPSSWKIQKPPVGRDGLFLKSPDGFEFNFSVSGMQGGPYKCAAKTCPKIENYLVKPVNVGSNRTIYIVHGKYDSNIPDKPNLFNDMTVYASDNPHPDYAIEAGAGIWFDLHIKNNFLDEWKMPTYTSFYGEYPHDSYQQKLSPEEYFKLEDIQVADHIISSVTYQ